MVGLDGANTKGRIVTLKARCVWTDGNVPFDSYAEGHENKRTIFCTFVHDYFTHCFDTRLKYGMNQN